MAGLGLVGCGRGETRRWGNAAERQVVRVSDRGNGPVARATVVKEN